MKKRWLLTVILFFAAVVSSYFALERYAEVKLQEKFNRKIASLPVNVSYSGIKYGLLTNDITINDLSVSKMGYNISAERITLDLPFTERKKEIPGNLYLKIKGLLLPAGLPFLKTFFGTAETNYKELLFNFNAGYSFNGNMLSAFLNTSSPDLGNLTTTSLFTNITKEQLKTFLNGTADRNRLLKRISLVHFGVKYRDSGLLQQFFYEEAKQDGISVEEFKSRLIQTIEENAQNDTVIEKKLAHPLINFIKAPSCLEIMLKPRQPISLEDINSLLNSRLNVAQIVQKTGMSIKACR